MQWPMGAERRLLFAWTGGRLFNRSIPSKKWDVNKIIALVSQGTPSLHRVDNDHLRPKAHC
jgi:hypothetical protein